MNSSLLTSTKLLLLRWAPLIATATCAITRCMDNYQLE